MGYDDVSAGALTYGQNVGKVSIFKYVSGAWVEIGDGITGDAAFYYMGRSVSLTDDGTTVAVGTNGSPFGRVEVHTTGL
jgi:hypothetical protein